MNRRELLEALTVERFTRHVRAGELEPVATVDWWKAYAVSAAYAEAVSVLADCSESANVGQQARGAKCTN